MPDQFRGGHIGYAIKPSERGKGFASAACALALKSVEMNLGSSEF
jgi:predicted acetyltransferase